uniref:Uncharacterized protein n=1 Tax=Oryza sativa subsp. japonica TaxID=39947 RepID=Q6K1Y2_ORYSJ|nr:hypothetical protein [Oryza sativa Japonica Group]BAD20149.1 hypothetical protein [Oryza sativa Japonica Group]
MGASGGGMRGLAGPRRAALLAPGPQTCSPSGARAGEEEDATAWRGRRGARPAPPPRRRRPRGGGGGGRRLSVRSCLRRKHRRENRGETDEKKRRESQR